jgi:hypothetical protein
MKSPLRELHVLNYHAPTPRARVLRNWIRRLDLGEDSFLACCALLCATIPWALTLVVAVSGGGRGIAACGSVPLCAVSCILSTLALLERRTSKTFPLISFALSGVLLTILFLKSR